MAYRLVVRRGTERAGRLLRIAVAALVASAFLCVPVAGVSPVSAADPGPSPTVVATGLNYPRGLAVSPDGTLYAAVAGTGNYIKATGPCAASPFVGSATGAGVDRVNGSSVTPVTTGLPSAFAQEQGHIGSAAVAFIGNTLYVLQEASGCLADNQTMPEGIYRVGPNGSLTLVANLQQFYLTHPVKTPDPDDFTPLGNVYGMTAMGGSLYVAEANHEEIDKVDPATGTITRLIDFSQSPWLGPTGITSYHGSIYFADLTEFPIVPGAAGIFKLNADGTATKVVSGLTAVTGLAALNDGTMYATELSTVAGGPTPGNGAVVRIAPDGTLTTIASGLYFPTGITVAPDGGLDFSDYSEATAPFTGKILHISVPGAVGTHVWSTSGGTSASFTVSFTTKTAGTGAVYFGTGPGCSDLLQVATQDQGAGTTSHTVTVTGNEMPGTIGNIGIQPGATYWYEFVTTSASGTETDNNGGKCYSVTIPSS